MSSVCYDSSQFFWQLGAPEFSWDIETLHAEEFPFPDPLDEKMEIELEIAWKNTDYPIIEYDEEIGAYMMDFFQAGPVAFAETKSNIEIVEQQCPGTDRGKIVRAIQRSKGDIVDAIMDLTP